MARASSRGARPLYSAVMRSSWCGVIAAFLLTACGGSVQAPPEPSRRGSSGSTGCGAPATGTSTFVTRSTRVGELDRTYHLYVPLSYQAQRAYPLVFRWHGSTGDGLSGGLGIEQSSREAAIIVAPDGLERTWSAKTRAADLLLFDALLAQLSEQYCIDRARIFSYGFSAGGAFTNELACARGELLRGAAAIASTPASSACTSTTAAWLLHDADDDVVSLRLGEAAREQARQRNGCAASSRAAGSGCVAYDGCRAGEPVVWCQTSGFGHDIRGDFAPPLVWQFFSALP
jgi:polyhydroxybutyrate depolymerase